jgi:putative FmdB family regulatory protein
MPTYEYLCKNCGHKLEKFQSITANPIKKCPECGKLKLKRLIGTGAGVIFKGSGFYETDYRSENYKKAQKEDKPSEKKKEETKSDKKTQSQSKSETKTSKKDSKGNSSKKKPA